MSKTDEKGIYWIKCMYQELSEKINTLMHQLQEIYKQYNVQCKTHEHFSIILRILTPIQILDKFSSTKNKSLSFDTPQILKNFLTAIDNQINNQIVIDNSSDSQINLKSKLYNLKKSSLKLKEPSQNLLKQQILGKYDSSSSLSSYINYSQGQQNQLLKSEIEGKKIRGRKPLLNKEQQKILVKWMEQQCRVKQKLVKQQIIKIAIQITKNESLNSNDIWFRKFMNKYKKFKQFLITKVKYVTRQNQNIFNLKNMSSNGMYPYKKENLQKLKEKNMEFIDLNQSESFEQIRQNRSNNQSDISSEQEKEEQNIKDNKKLRHDGEIQLSEAVQRFQHAIKRNRSQFFNKDSKSKKK